MLQARRRATPSDLIVLFSALFSLVAQPVELSHWDAHVGGRDLPSPVWRPLTLPEQNHRFGDDEAVVVYRSTVALAARTVDPAVVIGVTTGDLEVFVDGVRVGRKQGPLPEAFPFVRSATDDGSVTVELHIRQDPWFAKTVHHVGRVEGGPLLIDDVGSAHLRASEASLQRRLATGLPRLFFAAAIFAAGLYHLLLWMLRKSLVGYLWYGLLLVVLAAWAFVVGTAGTATWPALDAQEMWKVAPGVGSFGGAFFVEFAWRFLKGTAPPRLHRYGQVFVVVSALLCLAPGALGYIVAASPVRILLFVAINGATAWMIFKEVLAGSTDARTIVVGFGVMAAVIIWQVTALVGLVPLATTRIELLGFGAFVAAMAVALARRYARTLDDLDQTNAAIARFVPFKFLALLHKESVRMVNRGDNVQLEMSVMFSDIRGFTTLAEAAGPDATFRQINRYLSAMEPEIHKEGGYINQYLGDGIMSLFHTGTDKVLHAAIGMIRALKLLNVERATRGEAPLRIGVGINTGPLMLGTIGGAEQLDSGVVGDAANLAARVEGMTKIYGVAVLAAEHTVASLSPATAAGFVLRELDRVNAKGKKKPITIFEVVDAEFDDDVKAAKVASRADYARGLAAYRAGAFNDAAAAFAVCVEACAADEPAKLMLARCQAFSGAAPAGWDGVTELLSK